MNILCIGIFIIYPPNNKSTFKMSYSRTQSKGSPVMHCKVCESARKPALMISSHYPKNKEGITVCPTLLSQQCRHCGTRGHTIGYCKQKQKMEELLQVQEQQANKKTKKVKEPRKVQATAFSVLMCDSSDDEEKEEDIVVVVVEEKKLWLSVLMNSLKEDEKKKRTPALKEDENKKRTPGAIKAPFSWASCDSDSTGSESETDY